MIESDRGNLEKYGKTYGYVHKVCFNCIVLLTRGRLFIHLYIRVLDNSVGYSWCVRDQKCSVYGAEVIGWNPSLSKQI